jgi:hypothetical protein
MVKKIKNYIYKLQKKELFVVGFYISIIFVMFLAATLDFFIQNYTDVYFDLLFGLLTFGGLLYFKKSKNINIANHIIILISTLGSYVFLITSNFSIPLFVTIVSLSYFLLFSLKRSLIYAFIHQIIVAFIYFYAYPTFITPISLK